MIGQIRTASEQIEQLRSAMISTKTTSGKTHDFYLYPARFSPAIASSVISLFSKPGDVILDPFMGGGTAIVEGLTLGRFVVGVDINTLAHLVTSAKTQPLSSSDECMIRRWADRSVRDFWRPVELPRINNLPIAFARFMGPALHYLEELQLPRQRAFARVALLRLGQWALDCRDRPTKSRKQMADKLPNLVERMFEGLGEFVEKCTMAGVGRKEITKNRLLLCGNAADIRDAPGIRAIRQRPRLIFTSPPYPGVHVLYHRWQIRSRKETAAPYWIAQLSDGYPESHYTGGSRTPTGEGNYFSLIRSVFSSVRKFIAADGMIVQLVGFANIQKQLPRYLETMVEAGFEACNPASREDLFLWRQVPNRKWYARVRGPLPASSEVLLFHRPRSLRST